MLEQHIARVRASIAAMTDSPANKERLFVTNEDILGLPSVAGDNVFAVTAPQGTSLVVPDPDANLGASGERHYQCAGPCRLPGSGGDGSPSNASPGDASSAGG